MFAGGIRADEDCSVKKSIIFEPHPEERELKTDMFKKLNFISQEKLD